MMKITPKLTPEKVLIKPNSIVKKFYNSDGVLTLASEFDRKSGKLKKDVFMNSNGTKPVRISCPECQWPFLQGLLVPATENRTVEQVRHGDTQCLLLLFLNQALQTAETTDMETQECGRHLT